jgi:radical SAM superfamily enzyme YgiQ (UPF0313 family)
MFAVDDSAPGAVLISTYELGHQPFGLASPAAWLRRAGVTTHLFDLAKDRLDETTVRSAGLVGFHLPMHTATRLAAPVIARVRAANPSARIVAYGLYAPLNEAWLRSIGVDHVLGGEFEEELTRIARGAHESATPQRSRLPRLRFLVPDRQGLPPLKRYSTLRLPDGSARVVGYTEASRGCRHLCRHCPVVPIYNGQFRIVQPDVVLADIEAQVAAGAQHLTFGDPDFFNGPTHAVRIVTALHARHPAITYDATIKVEHLLRHRDLLPTLRDTGCLFVTSAVESIDDEVLRLLEKGHTRRDFLDVVKATREAGISLSPTFVPFHPWTTIERYAELLEVVADLDLIDHVAPIQLAIRLLVPEGSRLLQVDEVRRRVGAFDAKTLTYRWEHANPEVDDLQREIAAVVGRSLVSDRRRIFDEIARLTAERTGRPLPPASRPQPGRPGVAHLDEPWYCCAEPNPEQLTLV